MFGSAFVHSADMNMHVRVLSEYLLSVLCGIYLAVEFQGHVVSPCLTFWGTIKLFSTVAELFYSPASNAQRFQFLLIFTKISYFLFYYLKKFLNDSHPRVCKVVLHCGFDLNFPDDQWHWTSFHVFIGYSYIVFGEKFIQILCPFLRSYASFLN